VSRFFAYTREAFEAMWRNRVRSLLTMLGMIIGTASIIAVLGISNAATSGFSKQVADFGDQGIVAFVDQQQDDPKTAAIQYRDVALIAARTTGTIKYVMPYYSSNYRVIAGTVRLDGIEVDSQTDYPIDHLSLHEGRKLTAEDVQGGEHVALVTESLGVKLFGPGSALGKVARVNGTRFTVVGVYDPLKASLLQVGTGEDRMEIPFTVYHEVRPGPVDYLQAFPAPGVDVGTAIDAITHELHRLHGERSKYTTQDTSAQIGGFFRVVNLIAAGLTAIGGVSLLVAGIGIMNIMLVSVTERTKEIGLRKSIGASAGDITYQFLLEAVYLSLIGGGIGMCIGLLAVLGGYQLVEQFTGPAPIPYLLIISVAVGFSTLVGTVFGTYPAMRAGRLDPIEALRS
jgi:putative ABC transport system permease protein